MKLQIHLSALLSLLFGFTEAWAQTYTMSNTPLTVCEGVHFDPGGPGVLLPKNVRYTQTLSPATPGKMVGMDFTAFAVSYMDTLGIFDGADTTAPLIGKFTYYNIATNKFFKASNPEGKLTLRIKTSQHSGGQAGWSAYIGCYDPGANPAAVQGTDFVANVAGDVATLKGTGFTSNDQVQIQALFVPAQSVSNGGQTLSFVVPSGAVGDVKVKLKNAYGVVYPAQNSVIYCRPTFAGGCGSGPYIDSIQLSNLAVGGSGCSPSGFKNWETAGAPNAFIKTYNPEPYQLKVKVVGTGTIYLAALVEDTYAGAGQFYYDDLIQYRAVREGTGTVTWSFSLVGSGRRRVRIITSTVPLNRTHGCVAFTEPGEAEDFYIQYGNRDAPTVTGVYPASGEPGEIVSVQGTGLLGNYNGSGPFVQPFLNNTNPWGYSSRSFSYSTHQNAYIEVRSSAKTGPVQAGILYGGYGLGANEIDNFDKVTAGPTYTVVQTSPSTNWTAAQTVAATGSSRANSVAVKGNLRFVGGSYQGTMTLPSGAVTSAGARDAFLVKDSAGVIKWALTFGGLQDDEIWGVTTDAAGTVYIGGSFMGQMTLPNRNGSGKAYYSKGGRDAFVAAYSANGQLFWSRSLGAGEDDEILALAALSGKLYIGGRFRGSFTDPFSGKSLASAGGDDGFYGRYTASTGALPSLVRIGGAGSDCINGLVADSSGGLYLAGKFNGTASFGSLSLTSAGGADGFFAKADAADAFTWATPAGGTGDDQANGVAYRSGALYGAGYYSGTAGIGVMSLASAGNTDGYLARIDRNTGAVTKAATFGGSQSDIAKGLVLTADGLALVSGYFHTSAKAGALNLVAAGQNDICLLTADADLNWLQASRAGGGGQEFVSVPTLDAATGNVWIGGLAQGWPRFGTFRLKVSGDFTNGILWASYNPGSVVPVITSLIPTETKVGATVRIVGTGFSNAARVEHSGVEVKGFNVISNTEIQFKVPAGAQSGPVMVSNRAGKDTSAQMLKVFEGAEKRQWTWLKAFGGPGEMSVIASRTDQQDNMVLFGHFKNKIGFGPDTLVSQGDLDVFIVKISPAGQVLWLHSYGGPTADAANALEADGNGNIWFAGTTKASVCLDVCHTAPTSMQAVFLVKMDSDGHLLSSSMPLNAAGIGVGARAINLLPNGNLLLAGKYGGALYNGANLLFEASPFGPQNAFWLELRPESGNTAWARRAEGEKDWENIVGWADGLSIAYQPATRRIALSLDNSGAINVQGPNGLLHYVGHLRWSYSWRMGFFMSLDSVGIVRGVSQPEQWYDGGNYFGFDNDSAGNTYLMNYMTDHDYASTSKLLRYPAQGPAQVLGTMGVTTNNMYLWNYFRPEKLSVNKTGHLSVAGYMDDVQMFGDSMVAGDDLRFMSFYSPGGTCLGVTTDVPPAGAYPDGTVAYQPVTGRYNQTYIYGPLRSNSGGLKLGPHQLEQPTTDKIYIALHGPASLPPVITRFSPASGPVGATVGIKGYGLSTVSSFTLNGQPVASYTLVRDDSATIVVPAGATTGKIAATSALGIGTSATEFTVTLPGWPITFGAAGDDAVRSLARDADGNVYASLTFRGSVTLAGTTVNSVGAAKRDMALAKFNDAGTLLWVKRIGNGLQDMEPQTVTVDGFGNVLWAGSFAGIANVEGVSATLYLSSAGGYDPFLLRMDPATGKCIWRKTWGSAGNDYLNAMTVSNTGTIYTGGTYSAAFTFAISPGTVSMLNAGGTDGFVAAFYNSSAGLWAKNISSAADDGVKALEWTGTDLAAAGYMGDGCSFGATTLSTTGASQDAWLARMSPAGGIVWTKGFGTAASDEATALHYDAAAGNAIVAAQVGAATLTANGTNYNSLGGSDIAVMAVNWSTQNAPWVSRRGSAGDDAPAALRYDGQRLVLAGSASGNVNTGNSTLAGNGAQDALLLRYDRANGALTSGQMIGGTGSDRALALAVNPANREVFVGGSYSGSVSFPGAVGPRVAAGATDGFIARVLAPAGARMAEDVAGDKLVSFPVPFRDRLTIRTDASVVLIDATGRPVLTAEPANGEAVLDTRSLTPGLYVVCAGTQTGKVVKL